MSCVYLKFLPVTGIQQLIECLQHKMREVQSLAAETLSHLVTFRLAYSAVRRAGGIKHLVRNFVKESGFTFRF